MTEPDHPRRRRQPLRARPPEPDPASQSPPSPPPPAAPATPPAPAPAWGDQTRPWQAPSPAPQDQTPAKLPPRPGLFDVRGRQQAQQDKQRAKGKPTWSELGTGQKAAGIGCLSFIGLVLVVVVLAAAMGGSKSELETEALRVTEEVFGPCLVQAGLDDWRDVALVRESTETDGVVTVTIFSRNIATGADSEADFRVNTGLGDYTGIPNPNTGIPVNDAAARLTSSCE